MGAMSRLLRLSDPLWLLVPIGAALWLLSESGPAPESVPQPQPRCVTGPSLEMAIAAMGQDPAEAVELDGAGTR
jgi:hypothetical protein